MDSNKFILDIIKPSGMMTAEKAMNIYHLVTQIVLLKIEGDIVEFGCHMGRTSAIIQETLNKLKSKKLIHVYDSFEGLPKNESRDKGGPIVFRKGDLKTPETNLINLFKKRKLKIPKIHKGWFNEIKQKDIPRKISFAHLDGDFYSSIRDSLEKVYPRLSKGGIVLIDDYYSNIHKEIGSKLTSNKWNKEKSREYRIQNFFPGVKESVDEFLKDKKERPEILISGDQCHCYFKKL